MFKLVVLSAIVPETDASGTSWDYLSKPVDTSYLLVVLRGWLSR